MNLFPELKPFLVGFDDLFNQFDSLTRIQKTTGYPPYNIAKVDENKYVIEMAVAGFAKTELHMELKDNTLVVSGKTTSDPSSNYLYKGIADRSFTRTFSLADTVEIKNAELINGMLKIWLENIIPESKKPKQIDIQDGTDDSTKKLSSKKAA